MNEHEGNEMTDLELDIATELGIYADNNLDGKAFWAEVARLLTYGDDYAEEMYSQTY
jgi:hypothetical protein